MMDDKKKIDSIIKVMPAGYETKINELYYMSFVKEENDRILVIGMGSILKGRLRGLGASISFLSVEKVLRPNFAKDKDYNLNSTFSTDQHNNMLGVELGKGILEFLPLELDTDASLELARGYIVKYIEQDALPYFKYWKDIRSFLPYLEVLQPTELYRLFGSDPHLKKPIIWKLCNHPRYKEYREERLGYYEDLAIRKSGDSSAVKSSKRFKSIIGILDNTPALYDWDESYLKLPAFPDVPQGIWNNR